VKKVLVDRKSSIPLHPLSEIWRQEVNWNRNRIEKKT